MKIIDKKNLPWDQSNQVILFQNPIKPSENLMYDNCDYNTWYFKEYLVFFKTIFKIQNNILVISL